MEVAADDYLVADQRLPPPVHADEREQAVLDLVPLAGARREMADGDFHPKLIRQLLQFHLPKAYLGAIAATAKADPVFLDTEMRKSDVQGDPIHGERSEAKEGCAGRDGGSP